MFEPDKITRNGGHSNGSAQKDTPLREASKPLMLQGKMWVIARQSRATVPKSRRSFPTVGGDRPARRAISRSKRPAVDGLDKRSWAAAEGAATRPPVRR